MTRADNFKDLVNEAFISPLRSVLVVDDQYPTWEEIFNSKIAQDIRSEDLETKSTRKSWHRDAKTSKEILDLIKEFRDQNPGLIIDIHDGVTENPSEKTAGNETPQQLASHLHQSDLLILDYNLEGSDSGTGGDSARKILASVLANHHFNLVVVHTSEEPVQVMHECLRCLMSSCTSQFTPETINEIDELENLISDKEAEGEFDRRDIEDKLDINTYISIRHPNRGLGSALSPFMQGVGEFYLLSEWANGLGLNGHRKKIFFYWAIRVFEKKYSSDFSEAPPNNLSWHISDTVKWLRTSRGFVCFVRKGPKRLLQELEKALVNWKPTPSRLISAKYRHEISRLGAEVEDSSLRQKHAFAKFYQTIVKPGQEDLAPEQLELLRHYKLKDHVSRQSEMLSFLVEDRVANFGKQIFKVDESNGFIFHGHYGVDLGKDKEEKRAIMQYNHYICCLPSKKDVFDRFEHNEQLDSGHIFKINDTWWVCATPACDLQPGQNVIAFQKGDPSLRPFTALQLFPVANPENLTPHHINSGTYCYVEEAGNILVLGAKNIAEDSSKPAVQKVNWRSFIAKNGGVIENNILQLLELQLELDDHKIASHHKEASIVAKLRYEYALNYIQRVGISVARIGLEYVSK